ncbi:MAG: hypothetical protein QW468_03810 [Candidatus Bathyarchaeia archaeon]
MPKNSEYVSNPHIKALRTAFSKQRREAAIKINNLRLRKITFHTLRHWKEAWDVKKVLGHKSLQSTEVYINIEQATFQVTNDKYHVKAAHNLKEVCALLEAGF